MTIGIYRIYNKNNNNSYIGQSKNIENRKLTHFEDLKNNKHHKYTLQKEYNDIKKEIKSKYRSHELYNYIDYDKLVFEEYYKFEVLKSFDYYDEEELLSLEDEYILKYKGIQDGYNQKTNNEINRNDYFKYIDTLLNEFKESHIDYFEFINKKINKDSYALKQINCSFLKKEITISDMQKKILDLITEYNENFKKLTK